MGIVYQGYDPFADKLIAVKLAMPEALKDKDSGQRYLKMFFNEAHTAGMLKHPQSDQQGQKPQIPYRTGGSSRS